MAVLAARISHLPRGSLGLLNAWQHLPTDGAIGIVTVDEIEKMRDQKIVGLETNIGSQASIEDMLGIEADWDAGKIKKHLLSEFQKWNNRLNALSEGDERDNAQQMLDLIAEARKKHG